MSYKVKGKRQKAKRIRKRNLYWVSSSFL